MKRYGKAFWTTLFWKQNNWHRHGVFIHTLKVVASIIKHKEYRMIAAGLLHDIGKPFVAYRDEKDKITGEYSFTNHEEASWHIIKNWKFISNYTKNLVRYHYIIRDMKKAKEKGKFARYNRLVKEWNKLDKDFKKDLKTFMICDDEGKR